MKSYENYLFDLYGTLVDIHTDEEDPHLWRRMATLLNADGISFSAEQLQERYRSEVTRQETILGAGGEIDIAPVFAAFYAGSNRVPNDAQIASLAHTFRALSLQKLRLFPGTIEMLMRLRSAGKRVYLLSNAQALFTLPELEALNLLPYFDGIVISSREGIKKPDLRLYQRILQRYDLDPAATVMVGNDDDADCWGAARAGLDSMYIFTEQSPRRIHPLPENCRHLQDISQVI